MLIPCPLCGPRLSAEFTVRGSAEVTRPALAATGAGPADGDIAAMAAYVYLRPNPAGPIVEYWYHAQGCRSWLRVQRNTLTHAVTGATLAGEAA